ncbi:MAG: hypothetical protein PHY26_02715 [Bacilli bacterium]|nr:hypothetical protein [Bacilli bacterium]
MKKLIFWGLIITLLLLTGCGKYDDKDIVKDLTKKIENSKGYYIEGKMEIINNEDIYKYDVKVSYQEPELFRVSLRNKANEHEQIIIKNEEGVYVLTPSLNKSFKFQSEWPYNNSQVYLLQALLKDLKNDNQKIFEETENYYVFTTKVNYPNNRRLTKQIMYIDKDLNFKEIHVLDDQNNIEIKMIIDKMDMKATFKSNYFALSENMTTAIVEDKVKPVSEIDNIVYPMYIPDNTNLTAQDFVDKTEGERVILTFEGEKPFVLVEETISKEAEWITVPTYGDPALIIDTIGYINDNSVSWISNYMEYYIASDTLTKPELYEVARSINSLPVFK